MSSDNSLQKALMRVGDFHLRRDDRQMFGNYVKLSAGAGTPGPLSKLRRTAGVVETPVYDVPKMWWLDLLFEDVGNAPGVLTRWVPSNLSSAGTTVRVHVRQALDRDKQVATDVENLRGLTNAAQAPSALSRHLYAGLQIGVFVEILGAADFAPLGVQASLCEVTADDRDPYGDSTIAKFAQSGLSQNFLQPNVRRRQFFVQNWGASPLYVAFSHFAAVPGATAHWTMALPNRGDIYESPRDCWQGYVSGVWAAAGGADDVAMVTEGY